MKPGDKVSADSCQILGARRHGTVIPGDDDFPALGLEFVSVDFGDGKPELVMAGSLRREKQKDKS